MADATVGHKLQAESKTIENDEVEGAVTGWDAEKVRADNELLFESVSRPHTSKTYTKVQFEEDINRPKTGPSNSREVIKVSINKIEEPPRPKSTSKVQEFSQQRSDGQLGSQRPKTTPIAVQYGVVNAADLTIAAPNGTNDENMQQVSEKGEEKVNKCEQDKVETQPPTISNKKYQGKIELEVEEKNRVWYKGRKVALMEHIHFKNTGKSLQEQISSISKLVREHDEKVRHLEERSATRGDLDALAKIKADKTIIDKENAIFAERTQKQLEDKCDLEYANQRLKTKVEWVGLKDAVSGFVKPMMFEIISQKLPEAVEETKAGLVQMIQRMFDVDPSQRADMEAVKALKEKCIELQKKVEESDRIHTEAIKGFTETVALVRAEVQESAEERLQEQIDFLNTACDAKLTDMTGKMEKLMQTSREQVKNSVESLKEKNQRTMLRMKEEGLEIVNDFVDQCKKEKKKFIADVQAKYASDMKDLHSRVKGCERVCADANMVISSLKQKMREQDNFVKQTLRRVDKCEKEQNAVSSAIVEFEKDCQDIRETEVQLRRDLTAVENVFGKLSKTVDMTSDRLTIIREETEENKKELEKKMELMIERNKASGGKLQGRVRALEDAAKNSQRKNDLRLQDMEKAIYDRLHLISQHQQQNLKDFKKQVEKLRKEINDKILKKTKAIENVNKVSKKQAKAVNSMQNKINEMTQEVKNFQNTEQKVKTLLEGMENGPNGIAIAALQKAEHVQRQLEEKLVIQNSTVQEVQNQSFLTLKEDSLESDPMVEQLRSLNEEKNANETEFLEIDHKLKESKSQRRKIIKKMRDAQKKNDKVTTSALREKLDKLDDDIEEVTMQHENSKIALESAKQNVQSLKKIVIAGGTSKELLEKHISGNKDELSEQETQNLAADDQRSKNAAQSRQSNAGSLIISLPSVSKSRERVSTATPASRNGNVSRSSRSAGFLSVELEAIQSELESERRLRLELDDELKETRRIQDALLHTQEQLREQIQGLKIHFETETKNSIKNLMERVETLMETNQIKQLEDMENQRLRLEKANEEMRRDQELLIKKLKDSNLTLEKQLRDSGVEFHMDSIANDENLLQKDNSGIAMTTSYEGSPAHELIAAMREQQQKQLQELRAEFVATKTEVGKEKVNELNSIIENMKKVHEDTLTEHKKEMERMNAKIAQHSLKVESYKAVAEADQAESNYAKGLIDEQKRILEQLDVNQLATKMYSIVEHKIFEGLESRFEDNIMQLQKVSKAAQKEHMNVISEETKKHIKSLNHASRDVQDTHEKHLSAHRESILQMANSIQDQHERHMREVQGVVTEVHKSLSDINENSKFHMKKFGIQSQQVQMKIADFEKIHSREEAKQEYRHMREMRKLQNLMMEDRKNIEKELLMAKDTAEKEHEQFIKFTAKLTHETDKMKRKYEQQLADLQLRIQNGFTSKEAVKNQISAYADMETRNRMENTEMKRIDPHMIRVPEVQNEASTEDPYENKNTVPHRPSAAIENTRAQHIHLDNPDTPLILKDNTKNAERQWKYSRTGSEGPSIYTPYSVDKVHEYYGNGKKDNLYIGAKQDGDVELFMHKTEFALNSTKQLIVAVHERLSSEIVGLQDTIKRLPDIDDITEKISAFWSQVGDLKTWKDRVVDLTQENKTLLSELRRSRRDDLVLKSPIRISPNKHKVRKESFRSPGIQQVRKLDSLPTV